MSLVLYRFLEKVLVTENLLRPWEIFEGSFRSDGKWSKFVPKPQATRRPVSKGVNIRVAPWKDTSLGLACRATEVWFMLPHIQRKPVWTGSISARGRSAWTGNTSSPRFFPEPGSGPCTGPRLGRCRAVSHKGNPVVTFHPGDMGFREGHFLQDQLIHQE